MNAPSEGYNKPEHRYLRESICQHIGLLRRELGHYMQTTHGAMMPGKVGIDLVAEMLVKCYEEPSAYNISNLSQYIEGWLKSQR